MSNRFQVIVIGGGIVGCSILYHLSQRGWNNILLLERRKLTSGSTWHAAGNVTFFGHYPSITRLYTDSVNTYLMAERQSGQFVGFHATGSLRLATNEAELRAYQKLVPLYDSIGVDFKVVDALQIRQLHPLLETSDIKGAAYTPGDGHVDPTGATLAMAKVARQHGAIIKTDNLVENLSLKPNGRWTVETSESCLETEHVVIANSFWARELVSPLDLNLPLYALEHHEIITDAILEIKTLESELPTIRDPSVPANIRQEGQGLLFGIYESNPKPWQLDSIPIDFGEELLANDIERLEPHLAKLFKRLPTLETASIKAIHNGPICYTPDGLPLLGPVNNLPGLWLAAGFCIGIGTGGGSGAFLSDWITSGKPPIALPAVYPNRFSNNLSKAEVVQSITKTYAMGYALPE